MNLSLEQVNAASAERFVAMLDGAYGNCRWIVEQAASRRPFVSLAQIKRALVEVVREADRDAQAELIRAHATLAASPSPARAGDADSSATRSDAGFCGCTPAEAEALRQLTADYGERFGFPFVLAVRGPRGTGLSCAEITATVRRRLAQHPDFEFGENLRNVHRIAELRIDEAFGHVPEFGNRVWDWAEELSAHSDPGFSEQGLLTVTYLTDAHQACARSLRSWMRECGFDDVTIDAVGNVVGIYHGEDPDARRLLTGSHYDTVRNGGKYDGRLGILVPMACVHALHRQGLRLPFGIEVVGFAEEEGQRYKATFLGSGALIGQFDPAWLEQVDADGVSLREAMRAAGLPADVDAIRALERDAARYLGFVEVHIEQGPVLNELDLPLGVVTSINGGVRYVGEIVGMASHAGTTPMDRRRDAATAAAELALFLERRASAEPNLVGTMGVLEVPGASINVVPGRCKFSLDIRATTDAVRDACVADVLAELDRICERRGVASSVELTLSAGAGPSAPPWQQRWERAVESLGLPVYRMPSGAGHDARKLHEVMPQAMLFMRGLNAGISHNPLESITSDDAELVVLAFRDLLDQLASGR